MKFRKLNLILHRDLGFLAFGLTIVYGVSGLAVNHTRDWNPSFDIERVELSVPPAAAEEPPDTTAARCLAAVGLSVTPRAALKTGEDEFKVFLDNRSLILTPSTGRLVDERIEKRPVLFAWNFLHTNQGRGAWTWFADLYAVILVLLAITGLFVIPGKKGLFGRGGLYVVLGILAPLAWWFFAGRP